MPCTARAPAICSTPSSPTCPRAATSNPRTPVNDDPELFSVSLVGRPNVGKSTLFNRLIGEERAVVHDRPGTTRDAIDTIVETDTGPIRFVDTAGMRRKAKINEDTEYYSLVRALKAVDESDVALLVIDATIGVTHQDQRLAERVDGAGLPDRRPAQQVGAAQHRSSARRSATTSNASSGSSAARRCCASPP